LLVVASRLEIEADGDIGIAYGDGYLTRRRTFQKFFGQQELREWIDQTLGVSSVAAGPGVFYVFRDLGLREAFLASRYRRRSAAPRIRQSDVLFQQHQELLEPLIQFVASRGRLPEHWELPETSAICAALGSVRRAFGIVQRVTGPDQWEQVKEERSQDLLIYLALARFQQRPKFSLLPRDLQLDVRAFFSTYAHACAVADELLFSAGRLERVSGACELSPVGKLTPSSLYVHASAVTLLPPLLRIYEGCARGYIGAVEGANIVKLSRNKAQVSYLSYPMFEKEAHPSLAASLVVPLQTFRVRYLDCSSSE
jgi:DNA phosphorothioation-associated putative methyltransferase